MPRFWAIIKGTFSYPNSKNIHYITTDLEWSKLCRRNQQGRRRCRTGESVQVLPIKHVKVGKEK